MSKTLENKEKVKVCRLCLKEEKFALSIFCDHSKQLNLKTNIQEYLNIHIKEDDSLPKYICYLCLSHLNFVISFINEVKKNENTLKTESEENSNESLFSEDELNTPPTYLKVKGNENLKRRINDNFKPIAKKLCPGYKYKKSNNIIKKTLNDPVKDKEKLDISERISDLKINGNNNNFITKDKNTQQKYSLMDSFKDKCNTLKTNYK